MSEKRFKEEFLEEMNEIKKEKPERVTVDDIIGLVDCEPTDSVTLKKEAQLSICEKRLIELKEENEELKYQLATLDGLYCSDKEDMSEVFRLDLRKFL